MSSGWSSGAMWWCVSCVLFFFSSRRRHTRLQGDWSSDVCSSDLGSATVPVPGYDVQALDEAGKNVAAGTIGNIVIKLPLPPGTLSTMWGNEQGYREIGRASCRERV